MPPTVFENPTSLLSAAPCDLGHTDWYTLPRREIRDFKEATWSSDSGHDDFAPPLMLLSLTNRFMPDLLEVLGTSSAVNYGTGQLRFNAPARAGDRLRAGGFLLEAIEVPDAVQTTIRLRLEIEGSDELACIVDSLSRWFL